MYKSGKKITVVIPTFNRAKLLKNAIESVLGQTYQDFDLLISDNGSTDNTTDVIKGFKDDRIVYYKHNSNIGVQKNWKFALTTPQTDYVSLLSDDDLYLPHHLETGISQMDKNNNAVLYGCTAQINGIKGLGYYKPSWAIVENHSYIVKPHDHFSNWLKGTQIASPSVIVKSDSFKYIENWGGINWPTCVDYLWWGQIAMLGDFIFDTLPGTVYQWHNKNLSNGWYQNTRLAASEFRYTVRTIANLAYKKGVLKPEDLINDAITWNPSEAAALVIALSSSENEQLLIKAAIEVYRLRPDLKKKSSSGHTWLAGIIGKWYLKYADKIDREIAGWPPTS